MRNLFQLICLATGISLFSIVAVSAERPSGPQSAKLLRQIQGAMHGKVKQVEQKLNRKTDLIAKGLTAEQIFARSNEITSNLPEDKIVKCSVNEDDFLAIQRKLLIPLEDAVMAGKSVAGFFTKDWTIQAANLPERADREFNQIEERHWKISEDNLEGAAATKSLASLLSSYKKVEGFSLSVAQLKREDDGKLKLITKFDLRGLDAAGWRRQDRGNVQLSVTQGAAPLIARIKLEKLRSLRRAEAMFRNVTAEAGLAAAPVHIRHEAIRRGGYALALGDLDGDGTNDMLVGTGDSMVAYKGTNGGRFEEWKIPQLAQLKMAKAAVIGDFDNDGHADVVVTLFNPDRTQEDVIFLRNQGGGKFTKDSAAILKTVKTNYAMPASAADFNGDGLLDLYVGFPGKRDFTFIGAEKANNLVQQGLFMNDGKGRLKTAGMFSDETVRGTSMIYPHSSMAADIDGDGNIDLAVVDDRGNLSQIYRGRGDGTFEPNVMNMGVYSLGMGVALASTRNDGHYDIALSSVNFLAAARFTSCLQQKSSEVSAPGLLLFRNYGSNKLVDVTNESGLDWAGEGLSGVEFVDIDNDGFQDLMVTNGLWSGTERGEEISSLFVRSAILGMDPNVLNGMSRYRETPTRSDFMEILAQFRGNVATGKYSAKGPRPSMAGFQHKRLFRNNGDGTFTEIGYLAGMDSMADGYIVTVADLDRDGRQDLLFRNGDPGTKENKYPVLEVYRNGMKSGNSLVISLEGNPPNGSTLDAVGAKVVAKVGDKTLYRTLILNNGAAQGEKTLHLGLGAAGVVDNLEITWPSRQVSTFRNVAPGRIFVKEGQKPVILGNR